MPFQNLQQFTIGYSQLSKTTQNRIECFKDSVVVQIFKLDYLNCKDIKIMIFSWFRCAKSRAINIKRFIGYFLTVLWCCEHYILCCTAEKSYFGFKGLSPLLITIIIVMENKNFRKMIALIDSHPQYYSTLARIEEEYMVKIYKIGELNSNSVTDLYSNMQKKYFS